MCGGYWMWKACRTILKRNDQLKVCPNGGRTPEKTSAEPFSLFLGVPPPCLETWPLCYEPHCWSPGRRRCSARGNGRSTETATTHRMASRPCCIFRRYRLRSRCNALWHMHPVVSMNVYMRSHQGRRAICRRSTPMIRGSGKASKMLTASEL